MRRWLFLVFLIACKNKQTVSAEPAHTASAPEPSHVASAAPSVHPALSVSKPASSYEEAMRLGRKAAAAKAYDDATAYFLEAVDFRDTAQAEAELGYAQLLAGKTDDAAGSLHEARLLTSDPKLIGQIEFNLGLLYEKTGLMENARAAFARSNTAHPSPAAEARLAGKSRCPAAVTQSPIPTLADAGTSDAALVAASWMDLFRLMRSERSQTTAEALPTPRSEAEAKKLVCGDAADLDSGTDHCSGAPPWRLDGGHLMFRDGAPYVMPVPAGFLWLRGSMDGGGCTGMGVRPLWSSSAALHGSVLQYDFTEQRPIDPDPAKCLMGPEQTRSTLYDTKTLRAYDIEGAPSIVIDGHGVRIPGCDPIALE